MKRVLAFSKRNFKEIMRDPVSLVFCLGLPLFLLIIFQQFNIPSEVYSIVNFTPAIIMFGFGFISLFSGTLIAKDRTSSFLMRLYASPLESIDFILGYSLSLIPIGLIQIGAFFICSIIFGLSVNINILFTIILLLPTIILFIGIGILIGTLFSDKTVPGITSLLINLISFVSGMWFDINSSGTFLKILARVLPFSYALDLARDSLKGNYSNLFVNFLVLFIYMLVIFVLAIIVFNKKMQSDKK